MTTREPNGDDPTPPATLGAVVKMLAARTSAAETAIERNSRLAAEGVARVEGMVGGLMGEVGKLSDRVGELERDVRHALRLASMPPPPPLPPMRATLDSKLDVREVASAIKDAALRGEKLDGTTPDEEVEKVIERVELLRLGRRTQAIINKLLLSAIAGGAAIAAERIIIALTHH